MKLLFLTLLIALTAVVASPAQQTQVSDESTTVQLVDETTPVAVEATQVTNDDTPVQVKFSIIDFILSNKIVLLGFLLALSEVLALIPGISQNGIFQAVFSWLKQKNKSR